VTTYRRQRLLLDTHVLLWWLTGDKRLSATAHDLLRDPDHEVFLSAVLVWEMAIKAAKGRLHLPVSAGALAADVIAEDGFRPLAIELEHAAEVQALPALHGDPFDRLLIAQARVEGLTLVTSDRQIVQYPVDVAF
jgi:PIN domain nuclease of toxin-antitoxin system